MSEGYRGDLAAALARIEELEARLASGDSAPDLVARGREHDALVRSVPSKNRLRLMLGLCVVMAVCTLGPLLFLPTSPYDAHPRLSVALKLFVLGGILFQAWGTWVMRSERLNAVAWSARLLASEQARAALLARAPDPRGALRAGDRARVAAPDPAAAPASERDDEEEARSAERNVTGT